MMDLLNRKALAEKQEQIVSLRLRLYEEQEEIRRLRNGLWTRDMELRHARARVREVEAILADQQTPKRDAGAQAFDRIIREVQKGERVIRRTAHNPAFEAKYGGHAGEGGLQRHSIGEIYPLIVYGKQWSYGGTMYHIMDARTGHTFNRAFESSVLAEGHAKLIQFLNQQHGTDLRIVADGRFVNHQGE